ncbi:MAG: TonB family protein [Pseudomonadaceae bacterium]|nr:TonB family protein [Pseudomonadaceae bacterium]
MSDARYELSALRDTLRWLSLALGIIVTAAAPAWANSNADGTPRFHIAMQAYQAENFEVAYAEFTSLAELGHKLAQANLGVMHFHGQGRTKNVVEAYGWVALAATDGDEKRISMRDAIYSRVPQGQRDSANQRAAELVELFGDTALSNRLMPLLLSDADCDFDLKVIQRGKLRYPTAMLHKGRIGTATIEYSIAPSGHARDYQVEFASDEAFGEAAINAARTWRYEPFSVNGHPTELIGRRARITFELEGFGFDKEKINALIEDLHTSAQDGGSVAAFRYASAIRTLPEHDIEMREATEWFSKAAVDGLPAAQYELGKSLIRGQGCAADNDKGLAWLGRAAALEHPKAQFTLATELIRIQGSEQAMDSALRWLERAAGRNHSTAMLKLAWILATHEDAAIHDPDRALALARRASKIHNDEITTLETLAAAYAATGDFKKASRHQRKAISRASKLDMPLAKMHARFNSYDNSAPWRELSYW